MTDAFSPLTTEEKTLNPNNKTSRKDDGIAIVPVPDDVKRDIPRNSLGIPSTVWDYHNSEGRLAFHVCRFDKTDGGKVIMPLTYRRYKDGTSRWAWKGLDGLRPLYNSHLLAKHTYRAVLICEGEKTVDAAQKLFPNHIVTTSANGAKAAAKSDWTSLKEKNVTIVPDNDPEGGNYAQEVAQLALAAGATSVKIVRWPDSFPEKWDMADELPEGFTTHDLYRLVNEAVPFTNPLDGLVERAAMDHGEAFKPEVLKALSDFSRQDRAAFETLRSKLKKARVRVGELDSEIAGVRVQNGEVYDPDQLELARTVVDALGAENLRGTDSGVWHWNDAGLWKLLSDRALKQEVHKSLEAINHEVSRGLVDAVTEVLKTEIHAPAHRWNRNPDAINVLNGELVLVCDDESWTLQPHCRENFFTTQIPHVFDPNADCPRFKQFLDEIFLGDPDTEDKKQCILEMLGYTLACHARFEKFILLIGSGANGKSVLLEIVRLLAGVENVSGVQPSQFSNRFQRAHLHLKLANIVTEIAEGSEISDAELKSIVSGESTTVEHKNKPPFDFAPYATCWFGANHMPHTRDFSNALFRRALIVQFNRVFTPGVNADPNLKEKLAQELPGIMNLALLAYGNALLKGKFTEPDSSHAAKVEWRMDVDQAAQFISERCRLVTEARISSAMLYSAYTQWAAEAGISRRLNKKSFTLRLQRHGCKPHKGTGGQREILGIQLMPYEG